MRAALLTREYPPEVYGGAVTALATTISALRARLMLRSMKHFR